MGSKSHNQRALAAALRRWPAALALAFMALASMAFAKDDSEVVATVDGRQITEQEIEAKIKPQLAQFQTQLYQAKKKAADDIIDQYLIEKAAKAAGLSSQDYIKRELEEKAKVSDEEVQKFYDEHKAQLQQPLDKIKPALAAFMQTQELAKRRQEFVANLRKGAHYKVTLTPPRVEVATDGAPASGPKDAPVTIVEFSDFQCPFCKRAEGSLAEVRKKYGDKIRLYYVDFPLSMHPNALKAAEAGQCANEQDKFWQFHDAMFTDQGKLGADDLKATAARLELDTKRFNQCLDQEKYLDAIHKDMSEGGTLGVSGTPAFFINGRFLNGAQPAQAFEEIIDDELARGGQKQTASN